jgi:phosphatidylglycerophosphate synthase
MNGRKIKREYENPIDNVIIDLVDKTNDMYYNMGFTPNILTTISLILGLLSAYLLYIDYRFSAAIFFVIAYYYDGADGYLARSHNMKSNFGDYYDHISDVCKTIVIIYVLYTKKRKGDTFYKVCILMIFMTILVSIHMGCQEKKYESDNDSISESKSLSMCKNLCYDENIIKYTRYFGSGTYILVLTLIILFY